MVYHVDNIYIESRYQCTPTSRDFLFFVFCKLSLISELDERTVVTSGITIIKSWVRRWKGIREFEHFHNPTLVRPMKSLGLRGGRFACVHPPRASLNENDPSPNLCLSKRQRSKTYPGSLYRKKGYCGSKSSNSLT